MQMKKRFVSLLLIPALLALLSLPAGARGAGTSDAPAEVTVARTVVSHTVVPGDTMWKLAVAHRVGLSEIISANPQITDPHWIYPGDVLQIPTEDDAVTSAEAEVVRLVNRYRAQAGLAPLSEDWELSRVARYKSRDMRDRGYFAHESPTYGSPFEMMRAFGIRYATAGENIAMGHATPADVVRAGMDSPGHRANILNGAFTRIGVGYEPQGRYWTQMFTG